VDYRQRQLQSLWLARAGVERAAARLLAEPDKYSGEDVKLIEDGTVKIIVERDAKTPKMVHVTCEAIYPDLDPTRVTHTLQRRVTIDGHVIRLEGLRRGECLQQKTPALR
jgi:hypothetical protein